MQGLGPSPALDSSVVPAAENLGHRPTPKVRGPRELGFFEQPGLSEALGSRAVGVSHGPGNQPSDGFDHEARGHFASRQHDVSHADLAVHEMLDDPMIDPLVPSAQEAETLTARQLGGHRLIEATTTGRQQKQRAGCGGGLYRGEDRLGTHHHPGTAAEWRIVHGAVHVGGVLAQIVTTQIEQTVVAGLAEQTLAADGVDQSGEDGEDVDAHDQSS